MWLSEGERQGAVFEGAAGAAQCQWAGEATGGGVVVKIVRTTPAKEYIHEAQYVAEVDVTLIENDHTWAPYFSIEDVRKLEAVRRRGSQAREGL
jgi:hypothetical protein